MWERVQGLVNGFDTYYLGPVFAGVDAPPVERVALGEIGCLIGRLLCTSKNSTMQSIASVSAPSMPPCVTGTMADTPQQDEVRSIPMGLPACSNVCYAHTAVLRMHSSHLHPLLRQDRLSVGGRY